MASVRDKGEPLVNDANRIGEVESLGLDETAFQRAAPERHTSFVTGFVDLERPRLLDVVPGRSARAVQDWLDARPCEWLADVATVALDPHRGYANGLLARLGHATVVIDHYHAIALANRAIDDVRRRTQNETLQHRGRKGDPLYGIRRTLLVAHERLTERGWARLRAGLEAGDPYGEVGAAYVAKEALRDVYAARSLLEARRRLVAFYFECADSEVPELYRLARTVSAWEIEILNYHTSAGTSNGPTEAMNLLVTYIRRVGRGFRNFSNYRLRLLLHCGVEWHTPPTARLRGRQTALVA
jgi:transposase